MRRSTLAAILAALFVVLGVRAGSADPRGTGAERARAVRFNPFHGGPASGFIADGSRVVLNEPGRRNDGSSVWPSDHYGVLAELALHRR